jgi:hypothetical protein
MEVFKARRPHNWCSYWVLLKQPSNRNLCHGGILPLRKLFNPEDISAQGAQFRENI